MIRSIGGLALLVAACSLLVACAAADPAPPLVDCPAGTRFVDGVGCVAELAFEAQPPPAAPPSPTPAPTATGAATTPTMGAVDPWRRKKVTPSDVEWVPATPKPTCGCAAGDLMCRMKCSATCKDGAARPCQGSPARSPVQNTGREFDRSAAVATLSAASGAARGCTGVTGTGRVRVVFAASGKVSAAVVEGAPFGGTPQGECIAAIFRKAAVPAFDGAPVAVTKSVSIP